MNLRDRYEDDNIGLERKSRTEKLTQQGNGDPGLVDNLDGYVPSSLAPDPDNSRRGLSGTLPVDKGSGSVDHKCLISYRW